MAIIDYDVFAGKTQPAPIETYEDRTVINEHIYTREEEDPETKEITTMYYIGMRTVIVNDSAVMQSLDTNVEQDKILGELVSAEQSPTPTPAKGRLFARLIHAGVCTYPTDVPASLIDVTYSAYTEYYQYQPPLTPPNEE